MEPNSRAVNEFQVSPPLNVLALLICPETTKTLLAIFSQNLTRFDDDESFNTYITPIIDISQ